MRETPENTGLRQALEMPAGLAQLDADAAHVTDTERLADKVVQRDVACDDVPPGLARSQLDAGVGGEPLDCLGLDERDVPAGAGLVELGPLRAELPVPLRSAAGSEPRPLDRLAGRLRLPRQVDPLDTTHETNRNGRCVGTCVRISNTSPEVTHENAPFVALQVAMEN